MTYDYSTEEMALANRIIGSLNEYLGLDQEAMASLVEFRVPANDSLLNHPSVQVAVDEGSSPMVGILGILNGILGVIPGSQVGYITAVFDDQNNKLLRFELTKLPT